MQLPTQTTPPLMEVTDYTILLYGPPKVGKSTFCAGAPNAVFLATEPGLNSLDVFQMPITSWDEMKEAYDLLRKGNHKFKTIIIDTVDLAFHFCTVWGRKQLDITHESDAGYGKGHSFIRDEFMRQMSAFASLPYGLILVSHSVFKEVDTRSGKRTRIVPTLPGKASDSVISMADIIMLADLQDNHENGKSTTERVLRCSPTAAYEAGDRTGHLPDTLKLEYKAVAGAFAAGGVVMNPKSPQELCDEITAKMDAAVKASGVGGLSAIWEENRGAWRSDYPVGVGEDMFQAHILTYKNQLKDAITAAPADGMGQKTSEADATFDPKKPEREPGEDEDDLDTVLKEGNEPETEAERMERKQKEYPSDPLPGHSDNGQDIDQDVDQLPLSVGEVKAAQEAMKDGPKTQQASDMARKIAGNLPPVK